MTRTLNRKIRSLVVCIIAVWSLTGAAAALADDIKPPSKQLEGHPRTVLSVNFIDEGKTLVSSSRDGTIKIWDIASGQLKRTLTNHTSGVYAVTFSHDRKLMASGSVDTTIILWDAAKFEPIRKLEGHKAAVRDLAFAPDDKTLASAGEDSTFRLWDVASGDLKVTRTDHTSQVKGVVYYPDGKTIATASSDKTLRLWNAETGEPQKVLKGHTNVVEFCAISPDGKQLLSGTGNIGEIIFWNALTGEAEKIIPDAHGNANGDAEVDCGRYSPDGKWAVSGSKDQTDKFWDPKTFKLLHTISGNPGRTECMAFSADGKQFAIGFALDKQSYITIFDLSGVRD